ncbi:MAG: hypothetical protein NVSMB66_6720 [Candidatus Doudnabacteria bacterium]
MYKKISRLRILPAALMLMVIGIAGAAIPRTHAENNNTGTTTSNGTTNSGSTTTSNGVMTNSNIMVNPAGMTNYNDGSQHVKIMIMTHLCNSNVKNNGDFQNLEAGKDPIASLANTVLNCPATALPGNEAVVGSVASPRTTYDFSVKGEDSATQLLSKDGIFEQHKLCESDIKVDVNMDGVISPTTCLDVSHYTLANVSTAHGKVDVTEVMPPAGFHYGTMRFTPMALDGNNDKQSFLATDDAKGLIKLDVTGDTDKMLMLHVYNFRNDNNNQNNGNINNGNNNENNDQNNDQREHRRTEILSQIQDIENQIIQLGQRLNQLINELTKI